MKSLTQVLKCLADETRLRIVGLLCAGEMCVCDLKHALGLPQSTVSRHLAHLKNAGLVSDRRVKTWSYYSLNLEAPALSRELLNLLCQRMAESEQARADRTALHKYRASPERSCT